MLELKHLRVLRAVADAGSFSVAADRLDYTQSAVSKLVASLERDLGVVLLDRGTRPLRLTDAGDVLMARAGVALEELSAARAELDAVGRLDRGRLAVATFSSAGSALVVDAVQAMRREHPEVELAVAERSMPSVAVKALRACEFDLAVTFDYPGAGVVAGEGLELHPLLDDAMDLVVPSAHRLARKRRVGFGDLAEERWIIPDFGADSPSLRLLRRSCAEAGFEPAIAFRINDCQMTQALVAAGEGIAVLPRLMLRPPHSGVRVRPLGPRAPVRRVVALRLPTRYPSPLSTRFLELLRAAGRRYAAPI